MTVVLNFDEVPTLTAEEEAGLGEAARSLDRGEGFTAEGLRVELGETIRR